MNQKIESSRLRDLVIICINDKLTVKESLRFIKLQTGQKITNNWFSKIKKTITEDDDLNVWLNHSMRIGWAIEHKRQINELDAIRKEIYSLLECELEQNDPSYKKVTKLSSEIRELDDALDDRYNANPMVSEILKKIQEKENANNSEKSNEGIIPTV